MIEDISENITKLYAILTDVQGILAGKNRAFRSLYSDYRDEKFKFAPLGAAAKKVVEETSGMHDLNGELIKMGFEYKKLKLQKIRKGELKIK